MSEHHLPTPDKPNPELDLQYLMDKRDSAIERLAEVLEEGDNKKREAELFDTIMRFNRMIDITLQK